jgi:hypothetical protein
MNRKHDSITKQLSAFDPVDPGHLDHDAPDELLTRVMGTDPGPGQRPQPRLPLRRMLVPIGAAAAIAAAALAIGLPGGGGSDGVSSALSEVAAAAAAQPAPETGNYSFLKTRGIFVNGAQANGQAWSYYHRETRSEWAAADGSGVVSVEGDPPSFVGHGDREAWEAAGSPHFADPDGWKTTERKLPAGSFEDVSDLSTDPAELSEQLRAKAQRSHGNVPASARELELIGEALRNPMAGPPLRAALYEAALDVPGIEYLGAATDPTGRRGQAVGVTSSYSGGPTVYSLVYDPNSTDVLANEQTALDPSGFADAEGPLVISATIYLESGPASSLPQ